jgi:hypothetical protein
VWVEIKNTNGLLLGIMPAGEATFSGNSQYINIIQKSCYLTVDGDTVKDAKYTLNQGVDVAPNEVLRAHCDLQNNFKTKISAIPIFNTYYRSVFGKLSGTEKQAIISFDPDQKISSTFIIPKPDQPQAYDALLAIQDETGKVVSNSIDFHYVLHGTSATIKNIRLDKDYYLAGDSAKVSFYWTGSADFFPNSRLDGTNIGPVSVLMTMKNSAGENCMDPSNNPAGDKGGSIQEYTLAIKKDCQDPQITVSVVDANNKTLAQDSFSIKSRNVSGKLISEKQISGKTNNTQTALKFIIWAAVIFSFFIIVFVIWKRKNYSVLKMFLFAILLSGGLILSQKASAETFSIRLPCLPTDDCTANGRGTVEYNVGIGKTAFSPGEAVTATGTVDLSSCDNTYGQGNLTVSGYQGLGETNMFNSTFAVVEGGTFKTKTSTFSAPLVAGTYDATFTGTVNGIRMDFSHDNVIDAYYGVQLKLGSLCSSPNAAFASFSNHCGTLADGYSSAPLGTYFLYVSGPVFPVRTKSVPVPYTVIGNTATCIGTPPSPYTSQCLPGYGQNLAGDTLISLVANSGLCPVAGQPNCTYYCNAGYVPKDDNSGCKSLTTCTDDYSCFFTGGECTSSICGTSVTKQANCIKTNSCTGATNVAQSECVSHGIPCSNQSVTCPACANFNGGWKEVSP